MSIYIFMQDKKYLFLRLTITTDMTTIKNIYLFRYHLVCVPFSIRTLLQKMIGMEVIGKKRPPS